MLVKNFVFTITRALEAVQDQRPEIKFHVFAELKFVANFYPIAISKAKSRRFGFWVFSFFIVEMYNRNIQVVKHYYLPQ